MKKIDFEAHFFDKACIDALSAHAGYPRIIMNEQGKDNFIWHTDDVGQPYAEALYDSLTESGEKRLKVMDASGVDIQALSLSAPGIERLPVDIGQKVSVASNDALGEFIGKHPDRFMGYAALAPKQPEKAADELERVVKEYGFMGWNTHSNFGDAYLDEERFWPILERAEKLEIPVYLHPSVPAIKEVRNHGFALAGAPFGFGMETAMTVMRLIYSGVFDKYPGLKLVLGHYGEGLSFIAERIDWAWVRPFNPASRPQIANRPSYYLKNNIWVTTSGNYFTPAFNCTKEALGIDRILLGSDYPYEETDECVAFIEGLGLSQEEKEKIYFKNAAQLGIRI